MPTEVSDLNVFILGAGFSSVAGAPLIRDFLDVSRLLFADPDSGLDTTEKEDFQRVFAFRKEVAQAREKFRIDLDDIEQLFGLVEMSCRLDHKSTTTRDATVYLIAKTLQLAVQRHRRRPSIRLSPQMSYRDSLPWQGLVTREQDYFYCDIYRHFALLLAGLYDDPTKAPSRGNVVISFNYDLILDDALRGIGIASDYALPGAVLEDFIAADTNKPISLLKLHGSTNWAVCGNAKCATVHILSTKFTEDPKAFRTKCCSKCSRPGLRLLLVPPSWDKSEYHGVIQPVWRQGVEALRNANRICIIGYSMPEADSFFKYLLTLGLAENHQLYKFVVVDLRPGRSFTFGEQEETPKKLAIETRYRELLEAVFLKRRFEFLDDGFADFLSSGAIGTLTGRAETIMLQGRV